MWLNLGGLAYVNNMELGYTNKQYLMGSDVSINSFGLARNLTPRGDDASDRGVLGLSVMIMDLGEIIETTENQPEGTGVMLEPQYFNASLSYAKKFSRWVSSGISTKVITQSVQGASAVGVALDAGIQYQSLDQRAKGGISIKNLGPKMRFNGPGFSETSTPQDYGSHDLAMSHKRELFELPAQLLLSASYDVMSDSLHRLTPAFTFEVNSYTHDNYRVGVEYAYKEMFMGRIGYAYQSGIFGEDRTTVHTGLAAGFTFNVPFNFKENKTMSEEGSNDVELAFDYAYQSTNPFGGIHSLGTVLKF